MARVWYYTRDGQQMGPVAEDELQRLARSGALSPTELVWTDTMANWTVAGSIPGLIPTGRTADPTPAAIPPAPRAPRPERGRRDERPERLDDEYEDFDDRPRRKRRQGMSAGLVIGLIGGGLFLVVLVGAGFIVAIVLLVADRDETEGTRSWRLNTNEKATYYIYFKKGHRVDITVKSTGQSDVDLFVYDGNNLIVKDDSPSSNCFVSFEPAVSRSYRVEVWNRLVVPPPVGMGIVNGPNSGTLYFKQTELSNSPRDNKGPPLGGQAPAGSDLDTGANLPLGQRLPYNVMLQAHVKYTIDLKSRSFDSYLELYDPNGVKVAEDDDSGGFPDARIVFTPAQTGNYCIIVRAFDNKGGDFRLTVRH